MTFVLIVGATQTAAIEGISAAGADAEAMRHTPAADAELVSFGRPVWTPAVPVSPSGTATPALVTRAASELLGIAPLVVDAGLVTATAAPSVSLGAEPGADVRSPVAVRDAEAVWRAADEVGRALEADEVVVAESIPGGTTTALGVLRALGEPFEVSSSLRTNPLDLKHEVVDAGLEASGLAVGDAAGQPARAVLTMGDPVLAAGAGLVEGAVDAGATVTLAGGTQLVAAAALLRHAGVEAPLRLATTSFLADDDAVDLGATAESLALDVVVTDPGFERGAHPALDGYCRGEAKEGVGMGGALYLADRAGVPMRAVRERTIELYDGLVAGDGS